MGRIVFSTVGTLGDLHPPLAVARELMRRGHTAVIATHPGYRDRVEAAGVSFHPVRPDFAEFGEVTGVMANAMHETRGGEYIVKEMLLPSLRASYEDLLPVCAGADAVVTHTLSFAGVLAAERLQRLRIGQYLQPTAMLSAYDPPVSPALAGSRWLTTLGPWVWVVLWRMARMASRGWFRPVDRLRADIGLPLLRSHPLFDGASDRLNLALFSSVLAAPQPDWPPHTVVTGFCEYDRDEQGGGMSSELTAFLDGGSPPIVFTLGSSGVWAAAGFYQAALEAAERLGRRAVLLTGPVEQNRPAAPGQDVLVVDYAPYSELLPRAAAIVHQGGVGTTGQALRAGKPMVVVPFSHDQPDNGARCERLGVARVVPRRAATAGRLTAALGSVLDDPRVADRAAQVGERVRAEHGACAAAAAIERLVG